MDQLTFQPHQPKVQGQEIMEFLVNTRFEDLPPEVVTRAKHIVLDAVACMLAGRKTRELFDTTLDFLCPAGGIQPVGCDFGTSCSMAAWLNVTHAQTHDFNDGLNNSGLAGGAYHPGRIVVSAALAVAQQVHCSGKELLTAVVLGVEAAARMRNPAHHSTTADSYSAAVAAAKLMGADLEQMRSAITLSAFDGPARRGKISGYSGTVVDGGKGAHPATNVLQFASLTRSGVEAAMLAMAGYQGPGLDDNNSLSTRFSTMGLGSEYSCMNMYFKPWPTCRKTHAAIQAALTLREQQGVRPEDVEKIRIFQQLSGMYVSIPLNGVQDINYTGMFSLQYLVSCALLDGEVTLRHFRWPDRKAPQQYIDFSKKITVTGDNSLDGHNAISPNHGILEVELKNGQVLSLYCQYPLGSEPNGLTEEQRFQKFRTCAEDLSREDQDKAIAAIMALDQVEAL